MSLEDSFRRLAKRRRFGMLPLGPELDGFCGWLRGQGFCREVLRYRLWEVSHFNQYLRRLGVRDCREVERSSGERFICEHLPRCRCRCVGKRTRKAAVSSVRSFMDYLSERGLLVPPSEPETPLRREQLLGEYLDYLKCERNLAEKTIKIRRRYLAPFLEDLGADAAAERLHKLTPEQVHGFFAKYTDAGYTTRRCIQGTLRTFFRFCLKQGYLKRDLTQAIPQLRTYKLSRLPRAISDQDAQKVLARIDRTTRVGLRDFAIIELLHTYGVRGSHVGALRLEDIEWRQNRIRFPALKGGKEVVEPLSDEVGEALLEYLRHGRPHVRRAEAFLTTCAPFQPLRSCNVTAIVAERMRRAEVSACPLGSHAFRHAFASRMLKHGQSLKTIADMLGHRNINSTFIYTKVDLETLRQLPLDWPEV